MNFIVTGVSKGIGNALCNLILSNPENKVFGISRTPTNINKKYFFFFKGDINKPLDIENFYIEVNKEFNHIDVIINNAGMLINKPFEKQTLNNINTQIQTNFTSIILLTQKFLNKLGGEKSSQILNISSMGGFQGAAKFNGLSIYSASKGALSILTECLATEFLSKNIYVNCLCLGAVNTEMLNKAFPNFTSEISPNLMAEWIFKFCNSNPPLINGKIIPFSNLLL